MSGLLAAVAVEPTAETREAPFALCVSTDFCVLAALRLHRQLSTWPRSFARYQQTISPKVELKNFRRAHLGHTTAAVPRNALGDQHDSSAKRYSQSVEFVQTLPRGTSSSRVDNALLYRCLHRPTRILNDDLSGVLTSATSGLNAAS